MILLVGESKNNLKGTYVLKYIRWGEEQKFHTGATCVARVTEEREWYDLTGHERGNFFWPMAQQYKHVVPTNEQNLICNHNLFDVFAPSIPLYVLGGILNSTWVVLSKFQYGRPVGVEGNLKTEVIDSKMMLVPNPSSATQSTQKRIIRAFDTLKQRRPLMFLSERRLREMAYIKSGRQDELAALSHECELDMPDRRELDDAVLEMLGVESPEQRGELIDELYAYLREFFELTRQKEEKAIINKTKAKHRGKSRPEDIAAQIYKEITENEPALLRKYEPDFLDTSKPFDTYELPYDGTAEIYSDMFLAQGVKFIKGARTQIALIETKNPAQTELLVQLANSDTRGFVRVPHEEAEARRVASEYSAFLDRRKYRLQEYVEERTGYEEIQEKVLSALQILIESIK